MALRSQEPELFGNAELETWQHMDSGGFGVVYKARHKEWRLDVAVKLVYGASGSPSSLLSDPSLSLCKALREEADHMGKASSEYVLRVYGFYQGFPPIEGVQKHQQGIVMELIEMGSVQNLQKKLPGFPPRPLAFRLAHQVALGMNFLHSRNIVHQDLKPSNVLLTGDLHAKLADFGLSRVSSSALNANEKTTGLSGFTYQCSPPEAFEASYEPVRAYDRYSYGILLWSFFNGKEPYGVADYFRVKFSIQRGDRPQCDQMNDVEELKEVTDLMKRCWDQDPDVRPTFRDCLEITEELFKKHKSEVKDAVYGIQKTLESTTSDQQPVSEAGSHDTIDHHQVTDLQNLRSVPTKILTVEEKAKFVKDNFPVLIQEVSAVMEIAEELGHMVHSEVRSGIQAEKTSQDKMRLLYSRIAPAGGRVKAAFYDALKKHHPRLVEKLGG